MKYELSALPPLHCTDSFSKKSILKEIKRYIGTLGLWKPWRKKPDEILHCTIVLWGVDIFSFERLTIDFSKHHELANCLLVVLWINDLPFNSTNNCLYLQIFPIYFDAKKSDVYRLNYSRLDPSQPSNQFNGLMFLTFLCRWEHQRNKCSPVTARMLRWQWFDEWLRGFLVWFSSHLCQFYF